MIPLVRMDGIGKSFGGNAVLQDVSFQVRAGEIVALLGANGAGKSTLIKILTGLYERDAGTVLINGRAAVFANGSDALKAGIRLLPQELSIFAELTVAENILFADMPMRGRGPFARIDLKQMAAKARDLLDGLGMGHIDVRRSVRGLSVSEQRAVEIARALAGRARVLLMDEPTAALSERERERLFQVMRRLREQGTGIVFISHYLDEVFAVSDRVEVLRDGRNAGRFATSETRPEEVLSAMLGRPPEELFPPHPHVIGAPAFTAEKVGNGRKLAAVDLTVHAGEIHGVFALVGSGLEDLGKLVFGATPARTGRMMLHGRPFAPTSPQESIASGMGYVAAERKTEGLLLELSVRENLTLPFLKHYSSGWQISQSAETRFAQHWITGLGVRSRGPEQLIRLLSGGNQQKVCIGRWLVDGVTFLILEEPTRGVDIGARRDIYAHLRRLTTSGLAILMISSDAEEVAGLSDSATVLRGGRSVTRFDSVTTAHALMHAASEAVDA